MNVPRFNYLFEGSAIGFGVVQYVQAYASLANTEADRKLKIRSSGTFAGLEVLSIANTCTGSSTVNIRKNGVSGNQAVSVSGGSTGRFADASNSDAFAAGDDHTWMLTGGAGGNITVGAINSQFAADADTSVQWITRNAGMGVASTLYAIPSGGDPVLSAEADAQVKTKSAGTLKNLFANVTGAVTATTTMRTRINGVNGNQSLSIGSGTTGQFEDTVNTDAVVVDDLICWQTVIGAGSGGLTLGIGPTATFVSTQSRIEVISGMGVAAYNANTTHYIGLGADGGDNITTEANAATGAQLSYVLTNLRCHLSANTVSAASTLSLRKNSGAANQSISITASTSGSFEDAVNSDSIAAADTLDYSLATGATGTSMSVPSIAVTLAAAVLLGQACL